MVQNNKCKKHPNKVLLVYPRIIYFPVNFAYIFPCLKSNNIDYDFVDLNINPNFFANNNLDDYFAVATGGLIGHFFMMTDIFNTIKKINPNLPCILGGRVTGAPEYFLKEFPADYFVFEDADPALPNLLQAIYNKDSIKNIKGIAYKDKKSNFVTTKPEKRKKLDNFNPCWDDVDMEYYLSSDEFATGGYYSNRSYPIIIGMGCIGKCVFCNPVIKGFRVRPPANVVAEIIEAKKKYNITSFFIDSEIFYLKQKDVEEFCDLLQQNKVNLPFAASIRADADYKIIKPLYEAGCKTLMMGIESYDNNALKAMNKRITTDNIDRIVFEVKKNHINLIGGFLVGNPGDTEESIVKTAEFIINNDIICPIRPMGLMIYPSTNNYLVAKQKNLIHDEWDYFKKFCNYSYSIRITENGIGQEFPNITSLSNKKLWKAYSKASFKLYNHFMTNKVLRNAHIDTQTAFCCNCKQKVPIKKPVWMQICPECGYANYCDIHMMSITSEKKQVLMEFCNNNNRIAIAGTYHFKMALLKTCLDNGKKSKDLFIVEDNKQLKSFFQSILDDLNVIKMDEINYADAVVYAGLFQPETMKKQLLNSGFNLTEILNATPKSFKHLHEKNLYNLSYYFEFTNKNDLQTYGEKVANILLKNYETDIYWVLYSNCPLGYEISNGILKNKELNSVEYSKINNNLPKIKRNKAKIRCLITTPRMTGYTEITNELSKTFNISFSNVLGLKKDICPKLWSEMLVKE